MGFAIASDPLLAAAIWIGCGAFATCAAILVAIALLRVRLERRLRRERQLADTWNPLLAVCALHVPSPLPRIAERDGEAFLLLWCKAQESLRGEAQENLVELARDAGAEAIAHRLLRSNAPRSELLAIVVLGHLRARSVLPLLEALIPAGASLVSLTAAHALLRIDPERALPQVLLTAARRNDWSLAKVVSILKESDPAWVAPLLAAAIQAELRTPRPGPGLARLLQLHSAAHAELLREAVLAVLRGSDNAEALAAALGALSHPADASHARRLLEHPDWVVRVGAVRAVGRLGGNEDFVPLSRLLGDASWWVRYRAAQALCALPGTRDEDLEALRAGLQDRFAADTLAQALADRAAA